MEYDGNAIEICEVFVENKENIFTCNDYYGKEKNLLTTEVKNKKIRKAKRKMSYFLFTIKRMLKR